MKTPNDYFLCEWFDEVQAGIATAVEEGLVFSITGSQGSGRTSFCREIARQGFIATGDAVHCRIGAITDPVALLRDIFLDAGGDAAVSRVWSERRIKESLMAVVKLINVKGIHLLMIDEADRISPEGLDALYELLDVMRHEGERFGLVMTGTGPIALGDNSPLLRRPKIGTDTLIPLRLWTGGKPDRVQYLSGHFHINPLQPTDCVPVLDDWCKGTTLFGEKRREGAASRRAAAAIATAVGGNFTLLRQFVCLKNRKYPGKEFTLDMVEELAGKLPGCEQYREFSVIKYEQMYLGL